MKRLAILSLLITLCIKSFASGIDANVMQRIYKEVRTPYKYGMVVAPADNYHKIDCPTVFRENGKWYMTYVVYNGKDGTDGRGYETWLAESDDLLTWKTTGRLLSFKDSGWDMNQRGGFPALIDWTWGGSYKMETFKGRHWMTYIGGEGTGYEAVKAPLNIGMAWTEGDITQPHEWQSSDKPLLSINDKDVQWWEKLVQYKSTIYRDDAKTLGKRFIMFYNAGGINPANDMKAERIGIALSDNLKKWKRYEGNPVYSHEAKGIITGDAQIVKMDDLYVMFYFSAYNPKRNYNAFNTFSVSRDLIHWQDWTGADLIYPTKEYDEMFAHKSYVVKHDGVVYHFYCAVNNEGQRGIAVATSTPMGKSQVSFPAPETKGRRTITNLNNGWEARLLRSEGVKENIISRSSGVQEFRSSDNTSQPESNNSSLIPHPSSTKNINLPHNFDDYYGYRQLRHGNLHGSAVYSKSFDAEKKSGKRYFLQLEGVGTYATVTLNGTTYPKELVGRTVFTLDITDALKNGRNDIKIDVDHPAMQTESPWVCGGCSSEWGFSEGSQPLGIYRPVSLIETDEVRIEPFGVHIWHNDRTDSVFINTEVHNYGTSTATIEVVNKFMLSSGKQVFRLVENVSVAPGETKVVHQRAAIANPILWCPENPYLYKLASMIKRSGKTTDEISTPFGIRTISWPCHRKDGDGRFFLNGKPVFINGTCEYEHLLGQGHAFSPEQIKSRIKQIRNAGFNALREAHQPHNLLYQQLCDEQGIMFWSQYSAHIWYDTPQFRENFKKYIYRWIREHRNSPSVILWGLQNESVLPKEFAEECCDIIRSLDPTSRTMRAITTCNGGEGSDWNVIQNWSGTYGGNADIYDKELAQPNQLLNGEYGAWRTIGYDEDKFCELMGKKARLAEKAKDSVCGHFQWIFITHDNPGRVQPDGAYRRVDKIGPVNYKGLATIWEQPTKGYYMYRHMYVKSDTVIPTAAHRNKDLLKGAEGYTYLYRINCGGDQYTDEYGQTWLQDDTTFSHSWGEDYGMHPYQASQSTTKEEIHGTNSDKLFQSFRYGRHLLWYDFPLPDGEYRIELYFAEPWHGKGGGESDDYEGLRIFDVAANGITVADDIDPWAEAGYCGSMRRVVTGKAVNGNLRISFPEIKAGQAIISAIAIATSRSEGVKELKGVKGSQRPLPLDANNLSSESPSLREGLGVGSSTKFSWSSLDTDTIAKLPKSELPADVDAIPASDYLPVKITTKSGRKIQPSKSIKTSEPLVTTWTITPGLGKEYALRFRYKNVTGEPVKAQLKIVDSKKAVLVDREVSFPPTPKKFKMLSTTTGTQINAGTYTLTIEAKDLEFEKLTVQ